jgi:hypothetical protein
MKYRQFGKLDWEVSALGFGCMRLPTTDGFMISANVDEAEAIRIVRHAIDEGVNYIDTAYPYHMGKSEEVIGRALKEGYRDRVKLATKSPVWSVKKAEDFDAYLNEQLGKMQVDHFDYYLLHGLDARRWKSMLDLDVLGRAEAAVRDGRIGHIGFSFHDGFDAFKEIIDGYAGWEACLIQHNYMDVENQAGTAGLKYAASKGLAVLIMEPLLGGNLARPPEYIKKIFTEHDPERSPAEWALQWLWNQPEVSCVLSGMSNMEQVEDNLRFADSSSVNTLTDEELQVIDRVRKEYEKKVAIACTQCGYCMPCPNSLDIPQNMQLYNQGLMYNELVFPRFVYFGRMAEDERAGACTGCKECEEKCPQGLPISEWMPRIHAVLGEGKPYET